MKLPTPSSGHLLRALLLLLICALNLDLEAQIVNINGQGLDFSNPPVNNSPSQGDTLVYTNVFYDGLLYYDAIVIIDSIEPSTSFSGNVFDDQSNTQGNQLSYFSPRLYYGSSSGGGVHFKIIFIMDGTAGSPVPVVFQNFYCNSYDLDGGTWFNAKNQSTLFSNFQNYQLSNPTYLNTSTIGGGTLFECGINVSTAVTDDVTRVRVFYSSTSELDLFIGSKGRSNAYYYIDFSAGPLWSDPVSTSGCGFALATVGSDATCNGQSDGWAYVDYNGGIPPYNYVWSDGQTNDTAVGLAAGIYSVIVTDSDTCSDTVSVTITEPSSLNPIITEIQGINCFDDNSGQLVASVSGSGTYTGQWSTGSFSDTLSSLPAGNYNYVIQYNGGCTDTVHYTLTQPLELEVSSTQVLSVSCVGGSDGSVSVTSSGGSPGYVYAWADGSTDSVRTGLSAGSFSVVVTDAMGCMDSLLISVPEPTVPVSGLASAISSVSCLGGADGIAFALGSGGTLPYSYTWSNGEINDTATGLNAGLQWVYILDSLGCSDTAWVTVSEPSSALTVSSSLWSSISCVGGANGVAMATPNGGTPPYSFNWSNGSTTQLANSLSPGSYWVQVLDINGCEAYDSLLILDVDSLQIQGTANNINCLGATDGSILTAPTGGQGPYSYLWSTGEITSSISGLSAGSYWVEITDSMGCTASDTFVISEPGATTVVDAVLIYANPTCLGVFDGVAYASGSGGTAPYTYYWSSGQTSDTATGLGAGWHSVDITDANGCTATDSILIDPPGSDVELNVFNLQELGCYGDSNASIYSVGNGGLPNYEITWTQLSTGDTLKISTVSIGDTLINLSSGTYVAYLVDAGACVASASIVVQEVDSVYGVMGEIPISCVGGNDREAWVLGFGGTGPYSYLWDNGQINDTANSLGAGIHQVVITDALGCSVTETITITQPDSILSVSLIDSTQVTCYGTSTGSATALAKGGVPPHTYSWSNGASGQTANNLVSGVYWVTVFDSKFCSTTDTIQISEPQILTLQTHIVDSIYCVSSNSGVARVEVMGGTPPYQYNWSTGELNDTVSSLAAGNYSVTVTDSNGCAQVATISLTDPIQSLEVMAAEISPVNCFGGNDGLAFVTATHGVAPLSVLWSNGQTSDTLSGVSAGIYTVMVTDGMGCMDSASVQIMEPATSLVLTTSLGQNVSCVGGNDGLVNVFATGGTSPYSYLWSNGDTLPTTSDSAGTHWVFVLDALGCSDTAWITITEPANALDAIVTLNSGVFCYGDSDGSATVSAQFGTSPYSYTWQDGSTQATNSGLPVGWNWVIVTDALGCTDIDSIQVTQPDSALEISVVLNQNVSCFGGFDASATASVSGGTAPYFIEWDDTTPGMTHNALSAGNRTVVVMDANGCIDSASVLVLEPTALTATANVISNVNCFGGNTGEAYVSYSGGTQPYTVNWSDGSTGDTLTQLIAGTYIATITDSNGCALSASVIVSQPLSALLVSTQELNAVSCFGDSTGQARVIYSGGTSPYSVNWDNGMTGDTISGLIAGNYTAIILDANGCVDSSFVTISQPSMALNVSAQVLQNVNCVGDSTGAAWVTVSGGTSGYSVIWDNGSIGDTLFGVPFGQYVVTVIDSNGCSDTARISISQPLDSLQSVPNILSQVSCFGDSTGSANIINSGGTAPYTTSWDNGAMTDTINNLTAGTYTATITDAAGCATTAQITISQPSSALAISSNSSIDVTCFGANNGSASVVVGGGTSPYTYAWSNGGAGSSINGVAGGTYSVLITDANGCTTSDTLTIAEPLALTLVNTGSQNISCFGDATGSASISVNGGTAPYSISWSNGATGYSISNVPAGSYVATVTDANGCSDTIPFTLTQPSAALVGSIQSIQHITCFGDMDGALSVNVQGGTFPYSYSWSQGAITDSVYGLGAGSYTVVITDSQGCSVSLNSDILGPVSSLSAAVSSHTHVSCNGSSDGAISLSISGGESPYSISWSNGLTGPSLIGMGPGTYSYTVVDNRGCTVVDSVTIIEPSAMVLTKSLLQNIGCFGTSTGAATAGVTGGSAPYTYSWSNGASGASLSSLVAGAYVLTVTDDNGCSDTLHFIINQPINPVAIALTSSNQVSCFNGSDGDISISVAGGQSPYTINWSNGASGTSLTQLSAGNYTAYVSDQMGCMDSLTVSITEPVAALAIQLRNLQNVLCYGDQNGVISVDVLGGEAPYSYSWSNGATTDSIWQLAAGSFTLTVTDARGCSQVFTQGITEPTQSLSSSTQVISPVICANSSDGSAQVMVTGGTAPYSILWANGDTSSIAQQLPPGSIIVTITDANGCGITDQVMVTGPLSSLGVTKQVEDTKCGVIDNGYVKLTPHGGTGPYQVLWNHGFSGTELHNVTPGKYIFTLVDNFGCELIDSVFVLQTPILEANIKIDTVSCRNAADGAIDVTVTSGIGPFTYLLNGQPFTGYATNLKSGGYSVSIIDGVGCDSTFTVSMSPNDNGMYLHIPNAYTPNQDGLNEEYMIVGSECFENAYFEIVDRWGTLMFRTDKPFMEFWDGRRPDGTIAPQDVYAWRFVASRVKRYGTVSIIE